MFAKGSDAKPTTNTVVITSKNFQHETARDDIGTFWKNLSQEPAIRYVLVSTKWVELCPLSTCTHSVDANPLCDTSQVTALQES